MTRSTTKPGAATGAAGSEGVSPRGALGVSDRFLNRDLSWLEFNYRVLALALDTRTPLLERLKFLAIFSSNLDEFFMKRVGVLRRDMVVGAAPRSPCGLNLAEQLQMIRARVVELQRIQAECWERELLPELTAHGIEVVRFADATPEEHARIETWFRASVFPILTPLAVDPGHRFPFISNLSENLGVLVTHPDREEPLFARVKIPELKPRWVRLDEPGAALEPPRAGRPLRVMHVEEVLQNNLDDLFPGMTILSVMPFRVTRNAEVTHDEDADDLLETVAEALKQRRFARPVRLEVYERPDQRVLSFVMDELDLRAEEVFERRGMLEYGDLFDLFAVNMPELKRERWEPVPPPRLRDDDADIFQVIRQGDVLVHHPYESFAASVERFIRAAARDPKVVAIKQTIYRTSADSPFIPELIRAAESGKQVACLVELRARFEESANVQRAQALEKAGVHVAYGVVALKTHAKLALVVRREADAPGGLRCYGHIGTGNYNSQTAQLYTDLGLLTCDPEVTGDIVELFNLLTGRSRKRDYAALLVAPVAARARFEELIDREIAHAKAGRPARIVAKMNAMEDVSLSERLYGASAAGVKVDLIVRGFCCLRPGAPGLSENIRVISNVGRFLEHSRMYHFSDGHTDSADGDWFIGSADWMHRNLDTRVEAIAPIRDPAAKRRLATVVDALLADRRVAWEMRSDGSYQPRSTPTDAPADSAEALGVFAYLMKVAMDEERAARNGQ